VRVVVVATVAFVLVAFVLSVVLQPAPVAANIAAPKTIKSLLLTSASSINQISGSGSNRKSASNVPPLFSTRTGCWFAETDKSVRRELDGVQLPYETAAH
jgi:hypothetical protein